MRFRTAHFVKAQAFVRAVHPFVRETERKIQHARCCDERMSALDRIFQDASAGAGWVRTYRLRREGERSASILSRGERLRPERRYD